MVSAILLSGAIVAGALAADGAAASPSDLEAYRAAQSKAGHDARAHLRLALWCEAHGLEPERLKHLAAAVLYDASNPLARGLLGLLAYRGKWERPEVVGRQIQAEPAYRELIGEYLDRRARAATKPDAQMKLAAWCEQKGLKEQALAHYNEVIRMDRSREAAWKHLGYRKLVNRWVKPEELAAERQEAARQKQADKQWKPRLDKLRTDLLSKDAAKRARAEKVLADVTDPRAVPMIWALFAGGNERLQLAAVQMLGQIDGPLASNGVAALAIFSRQPEVRSRATETLKRRDPRDVVGRLIAMIRKPFKYQVRPVNGPGSPGQLFVEGERFNIRRFYENRTFAPALATGRFYTPDIPFDPYSTRNLMMAALGDQLRRLDGGLPAPLGAGGFAEQFPVSIPPQLMPQPAARAGHEIAANPQNAPAILNQLISNPANRSLPPDLWFMLMNQHTPANAIEAAQAARTLLHRDQVATNAANRTANLAFDMMLRAQAMAAQQDLEIARDLENIRQANQNLMLRLAMDIQVVEGTNQAINFYNDRALPVLKDIAGLNLGAEPEKWKSWWADQLGYSYRSDLLEAKPTYTDFVGDVVSTTLTHSCFAAGTLVQTTDGPRPIESIRTGDRVLSQGTSTGALAYQPVVATHANPPVPTLRLTFPRESIVATGIHRFWKAGKGWTMAREIKPGDRLRRIGGLVQIESVGTEKTQPVYNLEVAGDRDFFVGTTGVLVHDYSFVQPVLEPFDAPPAIDKLASRAE
jgi:hypothetical protein